MTIGPETWFAWKHGLMRASGWPMDTLHVVGGVLIHLLAAALMRRSLAAFGPWLAVLAIELANEAYDLWHERWPSLTAQLAEGARDIGTTMLLPTILLVIARRWPKLLTGRR